MVDGRQAVVTPKIFDQRHSLNIGAQLSRAASCSLRETSLQQTADASFASPRGHSVHGSGGFAASHWKIAVCPPW